MRISQDDKNLSTPTWNRAQLEPLGDELAGIRSDMLRLEADFAERVEKAHPSQRPSARNLLHYLALRQRDIRRLQENLAMLGLSSLGRTESHVLANIDAVMRIIFHLANRSICECSFPACNPLLSPFSPSQCGC